MIDSGWVSGVGFGACLAVLVLVSSGFGSALFSEGVLCWVFFGFGACFEQNVLAVDTRPSTIHALLPRGSMCVCNTLCSKGKSFQ